MSDIGSLELYSMNGSEIAVNFSSQANADPIRIFIPIVLPKINSNETLNLGT
jgi:hypothetical protein